MTTHYGVWSDSTREWWFVGDRKLFCVTMLGLAKAQAMVANQIGRMANWSHSWEARAIGEDGLPVEEEESAAETEERECREYADRLEADESERARRDEILSGLNIPILKACEAMVDAIEP